MKKEGYRRLGLFGSVNTYDNNGHKTSHSDRGLLVDSIITIIRRTGIC